MVEPWDDFRRFEELMNGVLEIKMPKTEVKKKTPLKIE